MVASKSPEFGQSFFILRAVAIVAVRFFVFGRMIAGFHLVERKHRHEMFDTGKFFGEGSSNPFNGESMIGDCSGGVER